MHLVFNGGEWGIRTLGPCGHGISSAARSTTLTTLRIEFYSYYSITNSGSFCKCFPSTYCDWKQDGKYDRIMSKEGICLIDKERMLKWRKRSLLEISYHLSQQYFWGSAAGARNRKECSRIWLYRMHSFACLRWCLVPILRQYRRYCHRFDAMWL